MIKKRLIAFAMGTCIYCQQTFKGRSDKKYCSVDCKNAFNNERRAKEEANICLVNKQLRKNWKIIKTMNPQGMSTVRKSYLVSMGFQFKYFTHIFKSMKGAVYFFCYDVGLTEISDTHVCIVNWQPYMDHYRLPIDNAKD